MCASKVLPTKKAIKQPSKPILRFESVRIESLFEVLDAIAFLDNPGVQEISQFAGIDPRTAGKLLKNARLVGLIEALNEQTYLLACPYPFEGKPEQKKATVREALLRLPLIVSIRQFLALGNTLENATRKAATVAGETHYDSTAIAPLLQWANSFSALDLSTTVDVLVDHAVAVKLTRHNIHSEERVAFVSHSSRDKPFVRQLVSDLYASGIQVWLDEQRIKVGDSIPDKVAQGLAESDFFLLVASENSAKSEWVKKELSSALVAEIEKRRVAVLPLRIDQSDLPTSIRDKKYADFSASYASGLQELLEAIKSQEVTSSGRSFT